MVKSQKESLHKHTQQSLTKPTSNYSKEFFHIWKKIVLLALVHDVNHLVHPVSELFYYYSDW